MRPTGGKNAFNHRAGGTRKGAGRKLAPTQRNTLATYFADAKVNNQEEEIKKTNATISDNDSNEKIVEQAIEEISELKRISKIRLKRRKECIKKLEEMEDSIWEDIMVGGEEDETSDIMSSLSRDFENLDIDNDNESTFESADKKSGHKYILQNQHWEFIWS